MATATAAVQKINYEQYREQRQAEFNALPIFYAFGNDQFRKACEERGFDPRDAAKHLYAFGAGGYYLKSDAKIIEEFMLKPDPLDELMRDPAFAESAFYYEMGNHEYHISYQGNWDVLSCFGNIEYNDYDDEKEYFKQLKFEPQTIEAFYKARKRFYRDAEKNDWY